MNPSTWRRLAERFAAVEKTAGRILTRAADVPTEGELDVAAASLRCNFHKDYVEFVCRYGGAVVGSLPVYGLRPVEVLGKRWSVVDVTKFFRNQKWPGTSDWYVISEDGFGNPIGVEADGRILTFDHDGGGRILLANDFEEFLLLHCLK